MTSDEERREVARRLRSIDVSDYSCYAQEYDAFCEAIGLGDYESDWPNCLADLIEPSEPSGHGCVPGECLLNVREMRHSTREEQTEYGATLEKMSIELHPVDRDALLGLAEEMESKASNWDFTLEDVPLVHAGYLTLYADRIREALGVES